jgi:Rv2258c-like winged HTH domain
MSTMDLPGSFDSAEAEVFAEKLLTALNHGALCLMLSVGHRTGLFDVMSRIPAATVSEIAAQAGLNERYVREWLGAMVTGRVIEVDPATQLFSLPEEHAAFLTRAAAADNLAVFAQYIAVLGGVEDDIVACFRQGGGVPYEKFGRFHEVMAEDSGQSVLSSLESHILPLVPGLPERLSRGLRWLTPAAAGGAS